MSPISTLLFLLYLFYLSLGPVFLFLTLFSLLSFSKCTICQSIRRFCSLFPWVWHSTHLLLPILLHLCFFIPFYLLSFLTLSFCIHGIACFLQSFLTLQFLRLCLASHFSCFFHPSASSRFLFSFTHISLYSPSLAVCIHFLHPDYSHSFSPFLFHYLFLALFICLLSSCLAFIVLACLLMFIYVYISLILSFLFFTLSITHHISISHLCYTFV